MAAKLVTEGDTVFVFASENEGGQGLIARGIVTHADAIAKKRGIARQTPRVSVTIRRAALAKRPLGRRELKHLTDWNNGRPSDRCGLACARPRRAVNNTSRPTAASSNGPLASTSPRRVVAKCSEVVAAPRIQ
jgi:hypothetical protein